jgi:hypothetical protein
MKMTTKTLACNLFVLLMLTALGSPFAAEVTEEQVKMPRRWFNGARGFEEARQIQFDTGADIFLYIAKRGSSSSKGLCTWWETKGMKAGRLGSFLDYYIQVELAEPGDQETKDLIELFFTADNGPTVYIIPPHLPPRRIHVFNWPGGRPELKQNHDLLAEIKQASSPHYANLKD